jgi:hypothetical protein
MSADLRPTHSIYILGLISCIRPGGIRLDTPVTICFWLPDSPADPTAIQWRKF